MTWFLLLFSLQSFALAPDFINSTGELGLDPDEVLANNSGFYWQTEEESLLPLPKRRCDANYRHLFANSDLRISIFFGYLDDIRRPVQYRAVVDRGRALEFAYHLQRPCRESIMACGFSLDHREPGLLDMSKEMVFENQKKMVRLKIVYSSVSSFDDRNRDPNKYLKIQNQRTLEVENLFYQALLSSDIVMYDGHSRWGAGPSFGPALPKKSPQYTQKVSFNKMIEMLSKRPTRLKMLGMYSCDSHNHFEKAIFQAASHIALVSTPNVSEIAGAAQMRLGTLDAVLSRYCEQEFQEALGTTLSFLPSQGIISNFFTPVYGNRNPGE